MGKAISEPGSRVKFGDGCGYIAVAFIVACVLFVLNGMMAGVLFVRLRPMLPDWANRARYAQIFILAVPIALILLEWYLWDWFMDRLRRRGTKARNVENE